MEDYLSCFAVVLCTTDTTNAWLSYSTIFPAHVSWLYP